MDGDVTSGLIGFDAEWERVLAGVMLSQSTGEGRLPPERGERGQDRNRRELSHRYLPLRANWR